MEQSELEAARAYCEERLAFAQRTGTDFAEREARHNPADVARLRGDRAGAEVLDRYWSGSGWASAAISPGVWKS